MQSNNKEKAWQTKKNGRIIFRDRLDEGRIKHHESIGNKVEEVQCG